MAMFQGSFLQIVARFGAILLGLLFVINGLFMLVSPRAYFKLPSWLAPRGGYITEKKYGSGWRAVKLRICGAAFLGTIAWVVYDAFLRTR
jgi:hypothetical protein